MMILLKFVLNAVKNILQTNIKKQNIVHYVKIKSIKPIGKADPYVPFLNGPLKNTAVEHENSIEYVTPYARRQYYEHKGDGLRGREWDKRMWADRGKEITQSVADYIGGKAK